jgi:tetratricopeptide (TPR) repeat protein
MRFIGYYIIIGLFCWGNVSSAGAPSMRSTAGRYLKMLQRKPASRSLFEHFYNSWDESEYGRLKVFLDANINKSGKSGISALWLLARLYEKEGEDNRAAEVYDKLLKRLPNDPNALLAHAQLNFYAGELEVAASDLALALKNKTLTLKLKEKCLRLLGRIQIRQNKSKQGIATWSKLIAISSSTGIEVEEDIIQLMLDEGLYDDALKMCIELRKKLPDGYKKVALGVRLGGIYHLKNERAKAVKAFAEIVNSVAGNSWIKKELYSRIEREFRLEDNITGLMEFYQTRVKKEPSDIMARKRYALLLQEQGDNKAAAVQFKLLMKLTPLDYRNREQYLDLLVADRQYSAALTLVKQLIKTAPNDYELLIKQAIIEAKAGHKNSCLKVIDDYLKYVGSNEYAWNRVIKMVNGWAFTKAEWRLYRQMAEKFPESSDAQLGYAKYLYRHGKKNLALSKFQQIAKKADRTLLLRIIASLTSLKESRVAFAIMQHHYVDYKTDFKFTLEMFGLSFALEQHQASKKLIEPLLKLASSPQELNNALAAIVMELKQVKGTEEYLKYLQTQKQLSINQQCLLIELEYNNGDSKVAIEKLKRALADHPTSVVLNSRLLYFQNQQGQTRPAIKTLERLIKLEPRRQIQYLREMIRLHLSESNYIEALKLVRRWKKDQPAALLPLMTEADIYEQSGQLEQAVKILKKASFKFPENKEINLALANYYLKNMNYNAAINIFWKSLTIEKSLAARLSLIQRIAELAKESGNREQLLSRLRNRMKSNPKNIFPLLALAKVYKVYNNYAQYRYYLVKATENQANNIELLYSLATLDEAEGNYDKAETTLKKIVKLDKSGQGVKKLIAFYFRGGEEDKGFALIANNAGSTMTVQSIKSTALVMFNARRYDKTVEFLQEFISKFPDSYELRYLYAIALEETGKKVVAAQTFFELLKMADNIKQSNLTKQTKNSWNRYYKNLPRVAADIIKMRQIFHTVYQYRNRNYRSSYGTVAGSNIIPTTKDSLIAHVITHLCGLAGTINSSEFNNYAARLKTMGIRYADIKMALASQNFYRETVAWGKLIEKYSNDVNITAVDCLAGIYNRQQVGDAEKYEKIIAKITQKHPTIALLVFFSTFQRQVELKPTTIKAMIELLKAQEHLSIYMLVGFNAIANSAMLDKTTTAQIAKIIAKLYLKEQTTTGAQQGMSYMIASLTKSLLEVEDYQTAMKLLQLSLSNLATTPTIPPYLSRSYSRQGFKFAPFAFPPQYSGAAPLFRMLIQPGNKILASSLEATPERLKKLWLAIEPIKNPELKLIMADYCGEIAVANKLAKNLINAEARTGSSIALVAAYYGKQKSYSEAIKAAATAAKLSSNRQLKKIYYTAAIYYALQLKQNKIAKSRIKELTGILLHLRLTDMEKASLAEALQIAGFTAEAEKIDQLLLKKLTAHKKINTIIRPTSNRPLNLRNRVKQLLKADKIAMALKISYRSIKQAANNEITAISSSIITYRQSWEAKQLIILLKKHNCQQKFLKLCLPTADKSERKQLEYAIICQYFNATDQTAKIIYQTLARKAKGNKVAQIKLFLYYILTDQTKALEVLKRYNLDKLKIIKLLLTKIIEDQKIRANPTLQLQLIDTISAIINNLSSSEQQAITNYMFNNIFQLMEYQHYSAKYNKFPGVLTLNPEFKPPFMQQKLALYQQQLAVYQRYLNACIKCPNLAQAAFSRKLTLRKLQHQPADENLFKTGIAVLKYDNPIQNRFRHNYSTNRRVALLDPKEFVITYAIEHDKIDYLKSQIKDYQTVKLMEFASQLYHCPVEEFIRLAEQQSQLGAMKGKMILAIYRIRKLKLNLDNMLLKLLGEILDRPLNMQYQAAGLAVAYLETLNHDTAHQLNFIQAVTKLIIKRYQIAYPNGMPTNGMNYNQFSYQNFYLLSSICQQFISNKPLMTLKCAELVLATAAKAKDFIKHANLIYIFTGAMQKIPLATIKDSPFVGGLKNFSFIQIKNSNNQQSLLAYFIRNCRHRKQKAAAIKFIEQLNPQAFGTEFMLACIKAKSKAKILTVCDKYLIDFDQLEPERQQQFMINLKQLFKFIGLRTGNPVKGEPGYCFYNKYFAKEERISPLKKANEFMKRQTIGTNYHKYLNDANSLVGQLAIEHPKIATAVIRHALKRLRILSLSGKIYTGNMRIEDIFASSFLGYRNKKFAQMGIVYRFMLKNRLFNSKTTERFQRRLANIAQNEWNAMQQKAVILERQISTGKQKGESPSSGKPKPQCETKSTNSDAIAPSQINSSSLATPPTVTELYLALLEKSFPSAEAPLLFTALYRLKKQSITELKAAAKKYATLPAPLSRIQREIKLNLNHFIALRNNSKAMPTAAYLNFYLEFINNPNIPLALQAISGLDFIVRTEHADNIVVALGKPVLKIYSRQNLLFNHNTIGIFAKKLIACPVTDDWRQIAQKVAAIQLRSYMLNPNKKNESVLFEALALYCKAGNNASVEHILALSNIINRQQTYIILANYDTLTRCQALLNKNWQSIAIAGANIVVLTHHGRQQANKIISTIQPLDQRFFVEIIFAAWKITGNHSQHEKLQQLAKKFTAAKFSNKPLREKCLLALANQLTIRTIMLPELFALLNSMTPEEIVNHPESLLCSSYGLMFEGIFDRCDYQQAIIRCEKFFPFFNGVRNRQYYNAVTLIVQVMQIYLNSRIKAKKTFTLADLKVMATFEYKIMKLLGPNANSSLFFRMLLLQSIIGQEELSAKWLKQIPEEQLNLLQPHQLRTTFSSGTLSDLKNHFPGYKIAAIKFLNSDILQNIFTNASKANNLQRIIKNITTELK